MKTTLTLAFAALAATPALAHETGVATHAHPHGALAVVAAGCVAVAILWSRARSQR